MAGSASSGNHDAVCPRQHASTGDDDDMIDVASTLTMAEVATILGLRPNRVGEFVSHGVLSARRSGNRLLFRPEDVEAFIESRRVPPGSLPWAHQQRDPATGRWR